jgi:AcrR family transcriptional regulator
MSTPPPVRKRVPAAERRRLLLDAADAVFGERGYGATGVEEVARRAGVTVPVLYDHFESKAALYTELVDLHYSRLRQIWFRHASSGRPLARWLGDAVEEWFGYVGEHPFAGRMLFREATGDAAVGAEHRSIQQASRIGVTALLRHEAEAAQVDLGDDLGVELAWETLRAVLQGLAAWWYDHPQVSKARIVDAAMNAIWIGLERTLNGDRWTR